MQPTMRGVVPDRPEDSWTGGPRADASRRVTVALLLPGTLLTLRTEHSRYRVAVLDGVRGLVRVSGGVCFPEETEAVLVGAGDNGERAGWIIEGLRLEFWSADRRVITSVVRVIDVDAGWLGDPARLVSRPADGRVLVPLGNTEGTTLR